MDKNDGNGFTDIAGATTAFYTTDPVTAECSGYKYRCGFICNQHFGFCIHYTGDLNEFSHFCVHLLVYKIKTERIKQFAGSCIYFGGKVIPSVSALYTLITIRLNAYPKTATIGTGT